MACIQSIIKNFIGMCDSPTIYNALSNRKLKIHPIEKTSALLIDCAEKAIATDIYRNRSIIRDSITQLGIPRIKIAVRGESFLTITAKCSELGIRIMIQQPQISDDTKRVIDFVMNCPHVSTVTAMFTDVSLFQNGKGSPQRLILKPAEYIGLNYRHLWRDSMDDYERLYRELRQNGRVDNFRYRMKRVDNSMAEYTANYYIAENYLGIPVRVAENFQWNLLSQ